MFLYMSEDQALYIKPYILYR